MLYKSCRDLQQKSIVPTHLPYVVSLVRFYETDSAIYLQLQHAAGGRLWSYVGGYLNQCIDATANVCHNVEPRRPTDDFNSSKTDHRQSDPVSSDANADQLPVSSDSMTVSASAACADFGESDLKSKLSLSDVDSMDDSREPVHRQVSVTSSPEVLSQGFSEVLRSTNSEMKYFRIDSCDSSERASRQLSGSSTEDGFCHVHLTALSSGVCRFCSEAETPRPAVSSDSSTSDSREDRSIYDMCHGETVDENHQPREVVVNAYSPSNSSVDAVTGHAQKAEVDQSWRSPVARSSRERSFDSSGERRRRRTLSSAFGELDLAASTAASGAAPPRPSVHLPESCIRQWAAEMVVAISRLHSIGIICRQVDLSCSCNILLFLQCFDTVGWAAGRASGL